MTAIDRRWQRRLLFVYFFVVVVVRFAWNNLIAHVSIRIEIDQSVCYFDDLCIRFSISLTAQHQFNAHKQTNNNIHYNTHGTMTERGSHTRTGGIDLFNLIEMATVSTRQTVAAATVAVALLFWIYDVVVTQVRNVARSALIILTDRIGSEQFGFGF